MLAHSSDSLPTGEVYGYPATATKRSGPTTA